MVLIHLKWPFLGTPDLRKSVRELGKGSGNKNAN
jgi:hypothetical protein